MKGALNEPRLGARSTSTERSTLVLRAAERLYRNGAPSAGRTLTPLPMPASVPIARRRISIDRAWLRREGYLGQHGDEMVTLEALRPIRSALLARALMPGALANAPIILVTSALPREAGASPRSASLWA